MPIQSPGLKLNIAELSGRLLGELEVLPRARIIAKTVADALPGSAVILYTFPILNDKDDDNDDEGWTALAVIGEHASPERTIPLYAGTLGMLAGEPRPLLFQGDTLVREEYAHVNVRRTLISLAYLPLMQGDTLLGAIEILGFESKISEGQLESLIPVAQVAVGALSGAQAYQDEHQNTLNSITRLTQLYDIEKVFSSTLEMDELLPIIGSKVREMLDCEAVNVWLLEPDESIRLMHQSGVDATVQTRMLEKPGDGIAGDVSDNGEPVLIEQADDERLIRRNQGREQAAVTTLIAAPILDQEALVGVIEAVNKLDGTPFDDDELFTLSRLTESAGIALHNASLLAAERKVEVLETLVHVSREITSTLNLEHVLQTIVNAPQAVIPYDRAGIGLEHHGKYRLSAVTGVTEIDAESPELAPLNDILRWALLSEGPVQVRQIGDKIDEPREETRAKFERYFQQTGMRAFYSVPLSDDTGRVGVLSMEAADPDFLSTAHQEILQVLAGQATVALRNAQMYKEVPFISMLEPVLRRKQRFMAMEKHRRTAILVLAAVAVVFLAIFPFPMRIEGDALSEPAHRAQIQPEVEGVVSKVFVHEGQRVTRGQVLAAMDDWRYRSVLAEGQAKYATALFHMNRALAANDDSEAGTQQVQANYWKSEVSRAQELIDRTQLRSPIDGVVATPQVENSVGRRLQLGDSLAEIVDNSQAVVDVAVDDADVGLIKTGAAAAVKLNSYPTRTFHGTVSLISQQGQLEGESRVFFARVTLNNPDGAIRSGMGGQGKVRVGWYPSGYVLFRRPANWIYSRVWNWLVL
jgi:RND family efflux transporter MFP subunit